MPHGAPVGLAVEPFDGEWVDGYLLAGPHGAGSGARADSDVWLWLDGPVTRGTLRTQVAARAAELAAVGLRAGGAVSLRMPPGIGYVVTLLAAWRIGAQVSLLDHRLTTHEVEQAVARIEPQFVVSGDGIAPYPGRPAQSPHAVLQLSSGSTGPSKVIGRTADSLIAEVERYGLIDGTPRTGERVLLLSSMVHVLGLVGGLLYGLHTGVELVVPRGLTTSAVLAALTAGDAPTTVLGVPFHIDVLMSATGGRKLPQLKRMTVGGELVRPATWAAFADRCGVPLGNMYGMTEAGVIATDLFAEHRPALRPAPGMALRAEGGELLLAARSSPYVGLTDPTRWADGWLHTRDAGEVDPATGLVTVLGRLDSQVSVGGLKVDLNEVEQAIAALPGVVEVVVAYDGAIEAFVVPEPSVDPASLKAALADRLAGYKRPRRFTAVTQLPRTSSGKLVRSVPALRAAGSQGRSEPADAAPPVPQQSTA